MGCLLWQLVCFMRGLDNRPSVNFRTTTPPLANSRRLNLHSQLTVMGKNNVTLWKMDLFLFWENQTTKPFKTSFETKKLQEFQKNNLFCDIWSYCGDSISKWKSWSPISRVCSISWYRIRVGVGVKQSPSKGSWSLSKLTLSQKLCEKVTKGNRILFVGKKVQVAIFGEAELPQPLWFDRVMPRRKNVVAMTQ